MSYILDALKRADAERERGAAPGLHTRHQVPAGSPGTPGATRNKWLALAAGLVLVMLALFFWVFPTPDPAPSVALAPVVITVPTPTPSVAPVPTAPPPAAITPLPPAPPVVAKTPKAPKARALPLPAASATKPVAVPATVAPLLSELPQDVRSQIPKITITGSVYSVSPAKRLLLVNNQVLPQGSLVSPDLTLEEIQPRSSEFSFKGSRFRVMH